MSFFSGLDFFILLALILIPAIVLGISEVNLRYYRIIASIAILFLIFRDDLRSVVFLIIFVTLEFLLIRVYLRIREAAREAVVYRLFLFFSILPLIFSKLSEITELSLFQFLGISYLTFRVVQVIIEIYDGIIKEFHLMDYLDFILMFATFSSGPIDRSRRFLKDVYSPLTRQQYLDLLGLGLQKIVLGIFYKVVLSAFMYQYVQALFGHYSPWEIFKFSYAFGLYMFFDFAGYSLMAIGTSYILGIKTPDNFNKPFMSINMKDFWNRWHMSLSFWFRDFIFSRIVMGFMRKKIFASRLTGASLAFIINMTIMGLWHGLMPQYILYGLYHGILLAVTEIYEKKSGLHKKYKNVFWYKVVSWALTINMVMFGFLIFSGEFTDILRIIIQMYV